MSFEYFPKITDGTKTITLADFGNVFIGGH